MENNLEISIIVDRTGSVENEFYSIEQSLKLLIESFKRKYERNISLKLDILIVGEEDFLLPTSSNNIFINKLKLEISNILDGINIFMNDKNSEDKKKIFLYSDGYFIDDKNILKFNNLDKSSLDLVCIGIGEGYDKETLQSLSSKNEVFEYKDVYNLI